MEGIVLGDNLPLLREIAAKTGGRYFRARTAAGIQGTGIGLHVAREIARLHGGDIQVASEEGLGTSVTLKIPFASIEEAVLLS